jgi:hypothetical protein
MLGWMDNMEYTLWGCKIIEAVTFLVISCSKEKTSLYINKVIDKIAEAGKNIECFPTELRYFIIQALTRLLWKSGYGNHGDKMVAK